MTEPPVKPGEILAGRFRVEKILGIGGMGMVIAAWHLPLDRRVALKFLLAGRDAGGEREARFLREARIAAKLQSEHVARVLDVGTLESGAPYIVMEYLDGCDLGALLDKGGVLPIEDAVTYVLQACEAIAEAHTAGIVHRDLKPANLFLTKKPDGSPCIKVCDFGISKLGGTAEDMTKTGQMLGSPFYMSPEQLNGGKYAEARSDIWSLGVILYEVLAGVQPFYAQEMMHLMKRIALESPTPLEEFRPDVPAGLKAVILGCLEKDQNRRFPSVATLAAALAPYAKQRQASYAEVVASVQGVAVEPSRPTAQLPPEPMPELAPAVVAAAAVAPPTLASAGAPPRVQPEPAAAAGRTRRVPAGVVVIFGVALVSVGSIGVSLGLWFASRHDGAGADVPVIASSSPVSLTGPVSAVAATAPSASVSADLPAPGSPPTATASAVPSAAPRASPRAAKQEPAGASSARYVGPRR